MTKDINYGSYFLPARKLKLRLRAGGALALTLDGQTSTLAPPKRMLPLSDPDKFILLYDEAGNELGLVRDVAELEPGSRAALEETLGRIYVVERITRVLEVEKEPLTGQTRWRVEIAPEQSAYQAAHSAALATEAIKAAKILSRVRWFHRSKTASPAPEEEIVASEEREFHINGQEDVQTARYPHIYVTDTEGNRYEVPDCEALDLDSRRAAERFF